MAGYKSRYLFDDTRPRWYNEGPPRRQPMFLPRIPEISLHTCACCGKIVPEWFAWFLDGQWFCSYPGDCNR